MKREDEVKKKPKTSLIQLKLKRIIVEMCMNAYPSHHVVCFHLSFTNFDPETEVFFLSI
jgi:hypothetical protein